MASCAAGLVGCRSLPAPVVRLDAIPAAEAIRIVNQNAAKITSTLRALGSADGHYADPAGGRRSFHLDGVLFFLSPRYFRMDLKSLGQRQMLVGSNSDWFWFYSADDDSYYCGLHGLDDELPARVPVRADQMIEALGLSALPSADGDGGPIRVQRVDDEHQQILFLESESDGRMALRKEYWLDRYPPRLIRRVVFRDAEGRLQMESRLEEYAATTADGPWLPHLLIAEWPSEGTQLRFRVSRWSTVPQVGPDGPQFATPPPCLAGPDGG